MNPQEVPSPAQPTMRRIEGISPEVQAQLDEFSRDLGAALVANLNGNVMAEETDEAGPAKE